MIAYSYDIFDTVLTRKTATPEGIFALMQDTLIQDNYYSFISADIRNSFFELRVAAERMARYTYIVGEKEEVTIKDIYHILNTTHELTEEMIDSLIKLEYETEEKNSIGVPDTVRDIEKKINNNNRVVFISDMYLPADTIRELLVKASPFFSDIPLYVSSEYGKTKGTGNLYRIVQIKENLSFPEWKHVGDNEWSDLTVPCSLGINSELIPYAHLLKLEQGILKSEEDNPVVQLMLGVSKNTRIFNKLNGPAVIGASLGGILLVSYVKWILDDAMGRGIKTLYFVARDGYVLKKIADTIIEENNLEIKTKYIYGSRKAWRMPALIMEDLDVMALFQASTPEFITSLSKIAEIFDISLENLCNNLGLLAERNNSNISRLDAEAIFYLLAENKEFKGYVKEKNTKSLQRVQEYLLQEIDDLENEIAFVEVGGTGYTQRCLAKILRGLGAKAISTYYFNLYSIDQKEIETFRNFIPDGLYIKDAIEPLCRAPHRQTVGYENKDGTVKPAFDGNEDVKAFEKCGYNEYISGIIEYVHTFLSHYQDLFKESVYRKVVRKCWNYYTHVSDSEILDFVGEIPFDVRGTENGKYAPKLSIADIKNIFGKQTEVSTTWFYRGASLNMSRLRMNDAERELMERLISEKNSISESVSTKAVSTIARIPKGRYSRNAKIVLYGAGGLGKEIRNQIVGEKEYNLIKWVDKNYVVLQNYGLDVYSPSSITEIDFDTILIAIFKRSIVEAVMSDLTEIGIPKEKIDWISPREFVEGSIE